MQINNIFQLNDWEVRRFLGIVFFLQFLFSTLIYLDIKFQIPILRQVLVFLFLTFIPGFILLRILRIHNLSNTESLLYSIGLSLAFLMFLGFFINRFYPVLGISKPFSLVSLISTINASLLLLCLLCYLSDKNFSNIKPSNHNPIFIDRKSFLKYIPPLLFILFLAVSGTYLMNSYGSNILLLIFLIIVSVISILVGFDIIPTRIYPFLIFIVALSLLYHKSLISPYLWGWDIQVEYYFANLVKSLSCWDYTIPSRFNSVLSTVIIAPMYSILGGIDLTMVFKIIYPFIFSLVPVGLYHVFRKEFDSKIAILSTFFSVFLSVYYNEMLQLGRQQIAELFLVLLIMLLINRDFDIYKKYFLFSVFMVSMIVSHYAIAYILVPIFVIVLLLSNLSLFEREEKKRKKIRVIQYVIPIIFLAFGFIWYMLFSSGTGGASTSLAHTIERMTENFGLLFSSKASEAIALIFREYSVLHSLNKILQIMMLFFISMAILRLFLKFISSISKKSRINLGEALDEEFIIFSILIFLALIANAILPFASHAFDTYRMYHLSLFGLAPFAVTGFVLCIIKGGEIFRKLTGSKIKTGVLEENSLKMFSILLAVFLLFNSGFLYEIFNDNPTSIALNKNVKYPIFSKEELGGANWIEEHRNDDYVWSSKTTSPIFLQFYGREEQVRRTFYGETKGIPLNSYIFLGKYDSEISEKWVTRGNEKQYVELQKSEFYKNVIIMRNKVYCNDNSRIYR